MNYGDIVVLGAGALIVVICIVMLILVPYLRDYTLFFDRLFGTMEPEEYYRERNYIGLYRRFKYCVKIDELGRLSEKTSTSIAEICRFASLADPERWNHLADPDVVNALAFLISQEITVDAWAKHESTDIYLFRIHLYHMNDQYRNVIDKYQGKYCGDVINSQRLIQFANELKEDVSHVKQIL